MPDKIKTKIVAADSVWIISHKVTGVFVRNKKGVSTERTLFQKGKLNQALVIESVLLTGADKERLASILARPLEDDIPETAKCFFAHHAIIWKKGKTVSWVDVCFSCHTLRQSKDIEYSLAALIRVNGRNCKRFLHKKGYQGMWMISERWAIQNQLSKTAVKC